MRVLHLLGADALGTGNGLSFIVAQQQHEAQTRPVTVPRDSVVNGEPAVNFVRLQHLISTHSIPLIT